MAEKIRGERVTKEELKQIYYLNKEIKMWQRELDAIECKSLIKGQVLTGMPFGSGVSDPTFNIVAEREKYRKIIEGKLAEVQVLRRKIIEYIDSIDDSLLRQIIFLRNVSCMSWNQVANEIGGNNTENSVRMMYNRHFIKE
jgi:hypothetical protein